MAARGHFVFPIDAKNHKVLVIWDLNSYGEYEFDWCICDEVMVGMFSPRWECFHLGEKYSHCGGNVLTAVGMFSPQWECSHTSVGVRRRRRLCGGGGDGSATKNIIPPTFSNFENIIIAVITLFIDSTINLLLGLQKYP